MTKEINILKNMEYVRTGGSKEELKCAKYIQSELKKLGLKSRLEEFPVQAASISKCSLEVTKPYKKKIECKGYLNSGSKTLTKELFYLRNKESKVELKKCKGKIVLIDNGMPYWTYKDLLDNGAVGFITCNGNLQEPDRDIDQKELRQPLGELGKIPGIAINSKDAYEMVMNNASEVKIVLQQKEIKNVKSRNVVCDIKGEDDQTIIFTAHYDSTPLSKGVYDNATGSVGILKVAEYYATHKPKHNLIFVWCGSEERGLLGSKAYCIKHKNSLKNIDLCINLDMIGSNMGEFIACVTGEDKLVHYTEYFSKEIGKAIKAYQDVYSSDSTPFADNGIPAISFARLTRLEPIHNRYDDIKTINESVMKNDCNIVLEFSKRMAESETIPVNRVMPDNMKDAIDYYLLRKRKQK